MNQARVKVKVVTQITVKWQLKNWLTLTQPGAMFFTNLPIGSRWYDRRKTSRDNSKTG